MSDLSIAWTGGGSYVVYSPHDDGPSHAYTVDLTGAPDGAPTCNCKHGNMNDPGTETCKHVREAVKAHLSHPDLEHTIMQEWAGIVRDANETLSKAEDSLEAAELSRTAHASLHDSADEAYQEAAEASTGDGETGERAEEEARQAEAQSAAETLQQAFDEHLEDMQVQPHAGHVWFKTGYDTEDEWPYPGVDETFQAITAPDVVEYVYESDDGPNHELYDEKPGQYWKNALAPGDVEEYIEEVLE